MSDKDKPVNPFGRGERTIIRPNPGGRLPPAPPSPTASARASPPSPAAPSHLRPYLAIPVRLSRRAGACTPVGSMLSPSIPPRLRTPYAAAPCQPSAPRNGFRHADASPPQQRRCCPPGPPLRVDDLVAPNANPIMRAAGPLLQLLGRLRVALMRASFASLMEQVADAIKFFEKDIRSAGFPSIRPTPRNTFCARLPTISCSISRPKTAMSGRNIQMLSRFFGERVGGVRFFEILDHLKLIRWSTIRCSNCSMPAWRSASRACTGPPRAESPTCS